jgi:hypothetical protein
MRKIIIRRCPVCEQIGDRADELTAALRAEQDVDILVEDGEKGEFNIEADGRRIDTRRGGELRSANDLADELHEAVVGA